jgi:hypothetical protein
MWKDEQADMTRLIVAFSQFCEGAKNRIKFSPDDLLVFLILEFVPECPTCEIRP